MYFRRLGILSIFASLLFLLSACASEEEQAVQAEAIAINHATQALQIGELTSVNGTYTDCTNRTGSWSIGIAAGAVLDNPVLSVVQSDVLCMLSLTELHTTTGVFPANPGPLPLTASYTSVPPSFGVPVEFYANAKLSAIDFADDFTLSILYSDDPSVVSASNTATYQEVVETVSTAKTTEGMTVPAPNYTLSIEGISVLVDVDDLVITTTGEAVLTAGSVTGQTYVLANAQGLTTYDALDAAYRSGTPAAVTATIPAEAFALVGTDLTDTQVRTLIIANANNGVMSYQAFAVTFNPPAQPSIAPSFGTGQTYAVFGFSNVTSTGPTAVTGDLGSTAVVGFPPGIVNGIIRLAADPAFGQAYIDLNNAYLALKGLTCDTDLSGQNLGGKTLAPGVYCYSASAPFTGVLTLDAQGDPDAVFVIQTGSTLLAAASARVTLINGANPCNVFWQVGSSATIGANSIFAGNIVALASITLGAGTSLTGRAIGCNAAITMANNAVTAASCQVP